MDLGQWAVIILSAIFLVWFLSGTTTNRKLGDQVLRWVQSGTKPIGRLNEAKRIRGSAVQLTLKDAAAPFRQLELIVALEPRENPPLWLYHHLTGKRNELVINGTLRSAPKQEWEVRRAKATPAAENEPFGASKSKIIQVPSGDYVLLHSQEIDSTRMDLLNQFLTKYGEMVHQLMLTRSSPHLRAHLRLAPLLETDPQEFFKDLQGLLI
jgi:hypothetical protein